MTFSRIPRVPAVLAVVSLAMCGASAVIDAQVGRDRTLYVSVRDKSGAPVTDLGPQEIVIREDGTRREVLRVSRAAEPIDIAILVDDSSAAGPDLLFIRDALTRFVELMHGDHNIAVIGLAGRPTILTDYTRDPARLKAAVGRIFAQTDSGMTLLDALVEVSKGLEKRETSRAVLLAVITDGQEYGRFDDREVLKQLKRAGVAFHAVTTGTLAAFTPDEMKYRAIVLSNGTRETGGRHDNLMAGSGLPLAVENVARELSSQLKVVYSRPQSLIPPERIEVSVTRPGLTARGTPARRTGGQP